MSFKHRAILSCSLFVLAGVLGCGQQPEYTGEERFPVSGAVTFQGEPIAAGTISLIPEDGTSNPSGGTIENGEFSVPQAKGPNKGAYRVAVYWRKSTGKKVADPDTGEQIDETKQVIPAKYNDATELSFLISGNPDNDKIVLKLE